MNDPRMRVIRAGSGVQPSDILARLDQPIRVVVAGEKPPLRHQLIAVTLVELLARLFPRLWIICEPEARAHPSLPPGPPLLADRLAEVRSHGHPIADCVDGGLTIAVGAHDSADVYLDGSGWQSYVGSSPSRLDPHEDSPLAVGPLCAAARGASQLFQLAFDGLLDRGERINSCYWSALDFRASADPIVEPQTALPTHLDAVSVGLGSVGGAAAYLFRHTPDLRGNLALVDPQELESHNYVRALLASFGLALAEEAKVAVALDALHHHGDLSCDPKRMTIADYVAEQHPDRPLPLVLCSVDSIAARRSIQDCMPLEIINAACSDTGALVSVHRTGSGPCLYCVYIGQVLDKEAILLARIVRATGFDRRATAEMMVNKIKLTREHLRAIAAYRGADTDAYAAYTDKLLVELYREELSYGETRISNEGGGQIAVASPYVTALTGFLLGSEALKAGTPELKPYRLGIAGSLSTREGATPTKYEESLFSSPEHALLMPVPRFDGPACLCQSERRLELMRQRYSLT
jgi:hypothetical protein